MLQIENMLLDIFCLVFRYYLVVNDIIFHLPYIFFFINTK